MFLGNKYLYVNKTFYSVGHGSFYKEIIQINGYRKILLYDCGSLSKTMLMKAISKFDCCDIDYLVISHFHEDHINGIDTLRNKCKIKNVFIPKLSPVDIAYYFSSSRNGFDCDIFLEPKKYWGNDTKVTLISPDVPSLEYKSDSTLIYPHVEVFFPFEDSSRPSDKLWQFKFYTDRYIFISKLSKRQKDLINDISRITDFEANKKTLKKAYQQLSKNDLNLTSMSMSSSPAYDSEYDISGRLRILPSSLLNGDIMLNGKNRIAEYTKHFSFLRQFDIDFQVPHHGSYKNFSGPLKGLSITRAVIQSGYNNRYGHPSGILIRKFNDSQIPLSVITENDDDLIINYKINITKLLKDGILNCV